MRVSGLVINYDLLAERVFIKAACLWLSGRAGRNDGSCIYCYGSGMASQGSVHQKWRAEHLEVELGLLLHGLDLA